VWTSKAPFRSHPVLDGDPVPNLSVDLQPFLRTTGRPYPLAENDGVAFIGSYVLGLGFTISPDESAALIGENHRNAEALFPYIIGKDLNRRPDCSASRWVINFQDWSQERASQYPDLMDRVRRLVKPERDKQSDRSRREIWWRFTRPAPELYEAITDLDYVLALSRVSDVIVPVRVPVGPVFAERIVVFATQSYTDLAVLSSSVNVSWVLRYASTMETRILYGPSDVFTTLPRPAGVSGLDQLGQRLDEDRRQLMLSRAWGLTRTYNAIHDPAITDPAIVQLREVHKETDQAVLAAYGWSDVPLEVGHHPTKIGIRWTISRDARFEILDRLLEENHRRHKIEVGEDE
jgi:hypothetical protein